MAGDNSGRPPDRSANSPSRDDTRPTAFGTRSNGIPIADSRYLSPASANHTASPNELSVRAENVLKTLAVELINETPPQGRWIPPEALLRILTYANLSRARNCGPQTTAEIIKWAQGQGKVIQPSFHDGKSLSEMWQVTIARFSTGDISKREIAEALEKSARRRNTRIPVAFQRMLLQLVNSSNE
jgi:hypothetical protein